MSIRTKWVQVFDGPTATLPTGLLEYAAWLNSQLELIPEEHRATAEIETWNESYEDTGDYLMTTIGYRIQIENPPDPPYQTVLTAHFNFSHSL